MLSRLRQELLATATSAALVVAGSVALGATAIAGTSDAPATTRQCTPDHTKGELTKGSLKWGLKSSFLRYIKGPVARGKWELTGGTEFAEAAKQFQFPLASGTYNAETKDFNAKFVGKVDFEGHKHGASKPQLKLVVENPELVGNGQHAKLYATVTSRSLENQEDVSYGRVELGNVTIRDLQASEGNLTVASLDNIDKNKGTVGVALTAAGVPAFADFYQEGVGLDPVNFAAALTYPETCTETPVPAEPEKGAGGDPAAGDAVSQTPAPGFDAKGCPAPRVEHKLSDEPLDQSGLDWAFTNVMREYAQQQGFKMFVDQGFPTSNSITFDRGADVTVSADKIIASWPGQVRFVKDNATGMTIGKPRIVMKPDNTGELYMTISSPESDANEFKVGTFHGTTYIDETLGFFGALRLDKAPVELDPAAVGVMPGITPDTKLPPVTVRLDIYERNAKVIKDGAGFFQGVWDNSKSCAKLSWLNHYAVYDAPPPPTDVEVYQPYQISVEEENKSWNEESPGLAAPGTLRWGIKKSWRSYTAGSVVSQSPQVTFDENTYVFTEGERLPDLEDGTQVIQYQGRLHYVKYGGILNIVFTEPQMRIAPDGTAVLWMKRDFALPNGDPVTNGSERPYFFPAVKLGKVAEQIDGTYRVTDAPAYLTSEMADIFIYAYRSGLRMSDLSFAAPQQQTDSDQSGEPGAKPAEPGFVEDTDATVDQPQAAPRLRVLINDQDTTLLAAGAQAVLRAENFSDGPVKFELHSEPLSLGSTRSENGVATLVVTIPASVPSGAHTVVATQGDTVVKYTVNVVQIAPVPDGEDTGGATGTPGGGPGNQPETKPEVEKTCKRTPSGSLKASAGKLSWAIKDSWVSYMQKPAFKAKWELSGGAGFQNGQYTFAPASGSYDPATKSGKLQYAGTVHFLSHPVPGKPGEYVLDMTISDPIVQINNGTGTISANVDSRDEETLVMKHYGRIVLANLAGINAAVNGGQLTISASHVTFAAAGVKAFGGFYQTGTKIAPLQAVASVAAGANSSDVDCDPTEAAAEAGTEAGADAGFQEAGKAPVTPAPERAKATAPKTCIADPHKKRVTSGALNWGLRQSFTTYIRGLAKGGWDLSGGANWDGKNFNFPVANGTFDTNTKTGEINFSGTMHFTGHKGVLDLTLSNPTLHIHGNQGQLWLTARSTDMDGKAVPVGRVHFANVQLNGVTVNGDTLSLSSGSVTLTAAGAKGFAGFYKEGEAMAPLSANLGLVAAEQCDANGNLQVLGADGNWHTGTGGLAATGAGILGAGATGLLTLAVFAIFAGAVIVRRRQVERA